MPWSSFRRAGLDRRPTVPSRARGFAVQAIRFGAASGSCDCRIAGMDARLLASELGLPEGPTVLPDGRLVFCDGNIGELSVCADGAVGTFAVTGGSPWGTVLGSVRADYVTQCGTLPGSGGLSDVG